MQLVIAALGVLMLAGCAGQPNTGVPVEERGQGIYSSPSPSPSPSVAGRQRPSAATQIAPQVQIPAPAAEHPAVTASVPSEPYSAPLVVTGPDAEPSPVLLALMEQADALEYRGDRQGALAQLERAQRIAPRDPLVYLQLARLRLHMDDRARAEQLARKGLSLSGADSELRQAFEALLLELTSR